jgi:coniferyl-aldehyde dehydrogenase
MRAASENLVPITLELGGKSPAIIDRGFSLATAARRVAYGKLANGRQTCVAPDYALVPEDEIRDLRADSARPLEDAIAYVNARSHSKFFDLS